MTIAGKLPEIEQDELNEGAVVAAQNWHGVGVETAVSTLQTNLTTGLTAAEAERRLDQYGSNSLETSRETVWYTVFLRQFVDVLMLILVVAAVISALLGEWVDAVTILVIVLFNGILGFVQEWKAEQAIASLKQMLSPRCQVVRDGETETVEAEMLVPGDIVWLTIGDRVPADLRLTETIDLKIDESLLTGESFAVKKGRKRVSPSTPLAERTSMAWMGTAVTNGHGRGIVVGTGMGTEFGRIAQLTQDVETDSSPLQQKLGTLGKQLGILATTIAALVAVVGWLSGRPLLEMFLTGVSLAVAAVPEGLPAVVTLTLALGIRAMVRRKALLRRLQAAETLGEATIICSDKTGTLTQNEMTVQHIWLPAGSVDVTGVGYDPAGHFAVDDEQIDYATRPDLQALLETGWHCNNARIRKEADGWRQMGSPTEAALIVAAYKAWLQPAQEKVGEFSFNSQRKRMTVLTREGGQLVAHVKGAPEVILARCSTILAEEAERPLTPTDLEAAQTAYHAFAEQGLRTLALARRTLPTEMELDETAVEQELTLLGIVGIIDPPRPEVPEAIRIAKAAGIQVIMITGDAAETAVAIANRVGLAIKRAITGSDLEKMDDDALQTALAEPTLFARTTPGDKLRIVSLLQQMGHVVGMTGDGVNDAPALKKADIGIAMGLRGTDVARGASDMVLTDDNFASIIGAVEEGRRQYDNIQKFVRYLLSSNAAEIIAIFLNIVLGGPLILLPVQILWMNLVTDGVTAVALGLEPAEKEIMERPPRPPQAPILSQGGLLMIALVGSYMGLTTLGLFNYYLATGRADAVAVAQTVAFTGLILLEKMNVFNFRALQQPLSSIGFFTNPWLLVAWAATILLQVGVVYIPFFQRILHTVPLGWWDWGVMLLIALPVFLLAEVVKWMQAK